MQTSMNKSELSIKLFEQFKNRRGMSRSFAAEIVDAIFGVAPRFTQADTRTNAHKNPRCDDGDIGHKVNTDDIDGILAAHLLRGTKNKVTIPGFGTLLVSFRKQRTGRHPESGDKITIPSTHVITFRAGKSLKIAAASDIN